MNVTSRRLVTLVCWLTAIKMTSTKPLPLPCMETDAVDLLGLSLAETSTFPNGVVVTREEGITGYRFTTEGRLLGVPSSEVMTLCNYFPREFSLILSFRRETVRNENEYLLTLLGQDRQTILIGVRLQRDKLYFDFAGKVAGQSRSARYRSTKFTDGEWHTVVITVTKKQIKFTVDCLQTHISKLPKPFPRKMNVQETRFHVASRRRKRNRFMGILQQVKFISGTDASNSLCSSTETPFSESWKISQAKKPFSNSFVSFAESTDITETCSDENRGQLMYLKDEGNLNMCEGQKWKKLATTKQRLDYVVDFDNLKTKSKTLDIEIFRIPGEGLFLASASQGRDKNMDSTIFKWSPSTKKFVHFQSISTDIARKWKYFTIANEHFLAVANHGSDEQAPVAQSVIYWWDATRRKFMVLQFIETVSARSWESFVINDQHYLAVANYASDENYNQKSWIYLWNADHRRFSKYQPLDTTGAYDFEHFQIGNNHYLAVANSFDGVQTRMDSIIYHWRLSNFVPLQYIETFGATDWEHFIISGRHFLAVANYYDYALNGNKYIVDSFVYEFIPSIKQFSKVQDIKTHGALDFEFFTVGRDSYLISASSSDGNHQLNNVVYRWQGIEHFVPAHNFSMNPCADWESFKTHDGEYYLVSANIKSRISKLLQLVTF